MKRRRPVVFIENSFREERPPVYLRNRCQVLAHVQIAGHHITLDFSGEGERQGISDRSVWTARWEAVSWPRPVTWCSTETAAAPLSRRAPAMESCSGISIPARAGRRVR